ncbi:beta-ketoacyl-[acyl-carrier-protein] synthase family protein [Planctomycetota bacterium]
MPTPLAVITGFGAISPLGLTSKEMWQALCAGSCGIEKIAAFDPVAFTCKIAGEVPEFKVQKHIPKSFRKSVKLMCRDIKLSIVAANEAIVNSGLITKGIDPENINVDPTRMSINLGAGFISCDLEELAPSVAACVTEGKFDIKKWGKEGIEMITPLWLLKYLPNMLACHIGIIHDIQGPSNSITCAEAGSLLAICESAQIIARGDSDIAVTGGAEAKITPMLMTRQCLNKRATSENNDDPAGACRPFDADAKGSVFGEAAGILVIENPKMAKDRDAKIYAEIIGFGQSTNINPAYEHADRDGKGIEIAIQKALAQAGIKPEDIDLVIPHGTGIPQDDLAEATAIQATLGCEVPVWPTKSMLSNTGAAGGTLDIIAAVSAMTDSIIPAAKNCDKKAEGCNLNIITQSQKANIKYALCCSYTYGGQTAAIVLKKAGDN